MTALMPMLETAPALPRGEREGLLGNLALLARGLMQEGFDLQVTCELGWLAEIFARWHAADGATRLSRNANPDYWPADSRPDRTLAVLLLRDGLVAGTAVQRLHWLDGSWKEAMESRRFFYGDQMHLAPRHETCRVLAPVTEEIADLPLVYSCGLHIEAPHGPLTTMRLARLAHGLALAQWQWSYLTARITTPVYRAFLEKTYGFTGAQRGVWIEEADGRRDPGEYVFAVPRRYLRRIAQDPAYGDGSRSLLEPPSLLAALVAE
jgi:hypothetical protein